MTEFSTIRTKHVVSVTYSLGKLLLETDKGDVLYVRKRTISKLAHALGMKKRELINMVITSPDAVVDKLRSADLVMHVFKEATEKMWVVYNVTTEKFTPVRHSDVRDRAEKALRELGVTPKKLFSKRYKRRVVYYFVLNEHSFNGVTVSVELAVSNANTAKDAVHVYPHIVIKKEGKVVALEIFASSVKIMHTGSVEEILGRVEEAVKRVYADLASQERMLVQSIINAINTKVSSNLAMSIIMNLKLPKKYFTKFSKDIKKFEQAPATVFDLLDFLNRLYRAVAENNERLAKKIMAEIKKLTTPATYKGVATKV